MFHWRVVWVLLVRLSLLGIELANQLGKLNLSDHEKLQLATKIEGHPDNVAPAIYGNLVIASVC